IQEAARKFDWQYCIGEWIGLVETALHRGTGPTNSSGRIGRARVGIICDITWLSSYMIVEHYYLVNLLQDHYGFEVIDARSLDADNPDTVTNLNAYDVLLVTYQGNNRPPLHLISAYKIFRIDDLVSYNPEYDKLLDYLISNSDMVVSPVAYEFSNY